ncbi:insulin growth factor-binding protein complex acid labile subunit [Danaus plexippus plexippus]|uniref:Insulin growth factor-binding protein complex acid labile subunit n=1 Tax=Danaus plexippus plexippus TaxID=278856 RepID=A0A212EL91_DANPL|nr:insulin growth factor-binding protein complex acid labile subunit [Danaus plexippus plexippus]
MGSRGVEKWRWLVVALAWASSAAARTLCPPRCACDDALRAASCANAGLEIVPIQLNPEATHINLTHNSIDNLLYTFGFYTQLTILDISYNRVRDLGSKNFDNNLEMTHLNVSHNALKRLDKDTFVGLKRLRDLDLSDNDISSIHPQTFKDLSVIETLDLSNNMLVTFEADTFEPLSSLRTLSLRNNSILEIPSANLIFLVHLEFLDLSENLIQVVEKHGIPYLKELKHLNLNSNIIESIDQLDTLQELEISGNPFVCNCSILWLWSLGRACEIPSKKSDNSSTILKIDYEEVKCAAPAHLSGILFVQIPESEFGCSSGWVVVAIVVLTGSIIISVVGGVLYFMGPLKKCKGDKSKQVMNTVMLNGDVSKLSNGLGYSTRTREQENKREVDRYLMIGSTVTNNFHSLNPPWHSVDKSPYYQEDSEEHIYQQFAYETIPHHRTPEKPHIVYV